MSRTAFEALIFRVCLSGLLTVVLILAFGPFTLLAPQFGLTDRQAHGLGFYGLMALGTLAFPNLRKRYVALICLALGAVIELIKPAFGHYNDIYDWLADLFGVGLALLPMYIQACLRTLKDRSTHLTGRPIYLRPSQRHRRGTLTHLDPKGPKAV